MLELQKNRSEAVHNALSAYLKILLHHKSRKELRQHLSAHAREAQGVSTELLFHEMRNEEDK